jgi:hypothetical protein
MSFNPFTVSSTTTLETQPSSEKIVAVSTSASDTALTVTASGTVSGSPDTDALALTGQREVLGADVFTAITGLTMSASPVGTVLVRRSGTAAVGDIRVDALPAEGDTLVVGLTGFLQTYTFRSPASKGWAMSDVAGFSQGDYFDLTISGTAHRFWMDINAAGTGTPAIPGGGTRTKVSVPTAATDIQVAQGFVTAFAVTGWTVLRDDQTVQIEKTALGTATITLTAGPSGSIFSSALTTNGGTADAANQIRTSPTNTYVPRTVSEVAGYIAAAINASSGVGETYGTGTSANAYVSAAAANAVVTLTDRVPCARQLTWANTFTGTWASLRQPVGGVNGDVVGTLTSLVLQLVESMTFNSPDVTATTLIASTAPTTDAMYQGGRPATLRVRAANLTSAVAMRLESSDDGETWANRSATYAITNADNNDQWIELPPLEYVRLVITSNPNTTDAALHAGIITW